MLLWKLSTTYKWDSQSDMTVMEMDAKIHFIVGGVTLSRPVEDVTLDGDLHKDLEAAVGVWQFYKQLLISIN